MKGRWPLVSPTNWLPLIASPCCCKHFACTGKPQNTTGHWTPAATSWNWKPLKVPRTLRMKIRARQQPNNNASCQNQGTIRVERSISVQPFSDAQGQPLTVEVQALNRPPTFIPDPGVQTWMDITMCSCPLLLQIAAHDEDWLRPHQAQQNKSYLNEKPTTGTGAERLRIVANSLDVHCDSAPDACWRPNNPRPSPDVAQLNHLGWWAGRALHKQVDKESELRDYGQLAASNCRLSHGLANTGDQLSQTLAVSASRDWAILQVLAAGNGT